MHQYVLTLSCKDRPGLVLEVAGQIASCGGNIVEAAQFEDRDTGKFFMRIQFELKPESEAELRRRFSIQGDGSGMNWAIRPAVARRKVLIMVSRGSDHCLGDLLFRQRIGELPMEIVCIASNHPRDAMNTLGLVNTPFYHFPVTNETRGQQESELKALIEETGAELVILARYMQILSDRLATCLAGRCINIHHSFLPGFKGAKPYHQAHARGVKLIGATAHYVTPDLDEGPIICQDVEPISHADSPDDLVQKGRDIERRVLARAVRFHLEDRVLLNEKKTVVFSK